MTVAGIDTIKVLDVSCTLILSATNNPKGMYARARALALVLHNPSRGLARAAQNEVTCDLDAYGT